MTCETCERCTTSGKGGTGEMGRRIVSGMSQRVTLGVRSSQNLELRTSNLSPSRSAILRECSSVFLRARITDVFECQHGFPAACSIEDKNEGLCENRSSLRWPAIRRLCGGANDAGCGFYLWLQNRCRRSFSTDCKGLVGGWVERARKGCSPNQDQRTTQRDQVRLTLGLFHRAGRWPAEFCW